LCRFDSLKDWSEVYIWVFAKVASDFAFSQSFSVVANVAVDVESFYIAKA